MVGLSKITVKPNNALIAMGRLSFEKGFDMLLVAFSKAVKNCNGWKLTIWGEGDQRENLEKLIEELDLTEMVKLPGVTRNPYGKMQESDLFVLSSRFEGIPNVLCEAMACGLPVVSFNCPSGPGTIIRDGYNGVLVPPEDVDELANTLEKLMTDPGLRKSLGNQATEISSKFSVEKVGRMWEKLFYDVTHGNK
jgi:glycosyltransferase involved in cell wall biosynthesis